MSTTTIQKVEKNTFPGVYVRLVGSKDKPEIWVYEKQGIQPLKCQYDHDGFRKKHEISTFFRVDVKRSENGKFYRIAEEPIKVSTPTAAELQEVQEQNEQLMVLWQKQEEEEARRKEEEMRAANKIPPIPHGVFVTKTKWSTLAIGINKGKYPILLGPKGCGKTEIAEALAKSLNMDFRTFNLGAASKPKQFFAGMLHATEKGTEFLQSDFLSAFQADKPTIIYLDEATRVPASAANYLMTILDRKQNYVYVEELGKRIYKSEHVRFISSANIGMQYTDTRTLDGAFMDRLTKLWLDYLEPKEEMELIMLKVPNAPKKDVERIIKWANICREKEKSGEITVGVSHRQTIDMADYLACGLTIEEVYNEIFMMLFVNGNQDEREHVKTFIASSGF